ncbi:MAG TPA: Fic family protein [Rhabdochlamydiaceae bacterium]|nr:Fic family protein [Rhabdochlamydiaceae bacterium]
MMYIHELKDWPRFVWNQERLSELLIQLRHLEGRLIGGMESIGFHFRDETVLQVLTQDVVKSSEIEGEILDKTLVRSSVARHLGMDIAGLKNTDRNIEGVVEMTLDATQKFDEPLTKERLLKWHALLFPSGNKRITVGEWRKEVVQVVSGRIDKETVHFEAPPAERVDHEMKLFLEWFNQETAMDLVLKAAIAHLWFVTIHPFEDGNGRIGRALCDLMLARSEKSSHRFYSLSAQIQKERSSYYAILEQTQKGNLDIGSWIEWFFNCMRRAIEEALVVLGWIRSKSQFWEMVAEISFNERQRKIINRVWDGFEGKLTSSKWAKIAKCSQDTAYRDILDLIDKGILAKNPDSGRNTSYHLKQQQRL